MSKINQKNKFGDNVGGNKITILNIPYQPILLLAILFLVLFFGYRNQEKIKRFIGADKVFTKNNSQFKILILPFKIMCDFDRNKDIGLHIKERLVELNIKDTLNINPYYLNINISKNFNADSAKYLQKYHRADQIIYGSYNDEKCSGTDGDEICYNWITQTDELWDFDSLQSNILPNSNIEVATIKDIRKGEIQGKTDYIIYWLAGLDAFSQNNYLKSIKHWLHLHDDLKFNNYFLTMGLGQSYMFMIDYNKSLYFFNKSISLSQTKIDSSFAINNLGSAYLNLGDFDEAKKLFDLALESDIINFGKKHPNTSLSQSNLATILREQGEYIKARDLLELALDSDKNNFGLYHPSTAEKSFKLAGVLIDLNEYEKAKKLMQTALKSSIMHFGEQAPPTILHQSLLAISFKNLGELEKSKDLLNSALNSAKFLFGDNHPTTAGVYSDLGLVYKDFGDFDKAKKLLMNALNIFVRNYGNNHFATSKCRNNLALVYHDLKVYHKAIEQYELSMEYTIKKFGELHPNTAICQSNLALVYRDQGNLKTASILLKKGHNTLKLLFGENHPDTKRIKRWLDNL